MGHILMLAEKSSQAEQIATGMGWPRRKGYYEGRLGGKEVRLCWASGHLLTLVDPEEVRAAISWNDPKTLIPIPRQYPMRVSPKDKKSTNPKSPKDYFNDIKANARGADAAVIATDPGREGEAIGWEILEFLNFRGTVKRLWLTGGLDPASIQKAMVSLRASDETVGFFRAAQARSLTDAAYMLLTRMYTYIARHGGLGAHLGSGKGAESVASIGRVQSPTLKMIVDRERAIQSFVSKNYFVINAGFIGGELLFDAAYAPKVTEEIINKAPDGVTWEPSKRVVKDGDPEPLDTPLFTGKAEVEAFKTRLEGAADRAYVKSFKSSKRLAHPPKTFSLDEAQSEVARALKTSASRAQALIESLYRKELTTYPRTENSELPIALYEPSERNGVLGHLAEHREFGKQAQGAMAIHNGPEAFLPKTFSKKAMEHFGIIPTHKKVDYSQLTKEEAVAYDIIAKRYIQALYPPAEVAVQQATLAVPVKDMLGHDEAIFRAKAEQVVNPGWMAVFGNEKGAEKALKLKQGDKTPLDEVFLSAKKTTPPARYNEVTLPRAMKNIAREVANPKLRKLLLDSKGLGTPATRSTVIETLKRRKYIEANRGSFVPTQKGTDLVDHLEQKLTAPEETALWEDRLAAIDLIRDPVKSAEARDKFVNDIISSLEEHMSQVLASMEGKLSAKPVFQANGKEGKRKPSSKQIAYAESLAKRKGVKLPRGLKSDAAMCSEFIEKHKSTSGGASTTRNEPSAKQINFAEDLAKRNKTPLPTNYKTDRSVCSQFIDSQLKRH